MSDPITAESLEAEARMPPRHLVDMRMIYAGQAPEDAGQRACLDLLSKNPKEFFVQLRTGEREYRQHLRELGKSSDKIKETFEKAVEEEDYDDGTNRVMELLEEEWQLVLDFRAAQERKRQSAVPSGGPGTQEPQAPPSDQGARSQ